MAMSKYTAREEAYRKATSVASRAAEQRAARGLPPRDSSKPAYTMADYKRDFPSKKVAPPTAVMPAAPAGGAAAPVGGMGGAGGTQQMIKKGGMTYNTGGMTPVKKPMGLQARQFGTGPGMRPMPKHLGKAVTDRGKAILGKAEGGMTNKSGRDGCAIRGKTRA